MNGITVNDNGSSSSYFNGGVNGVNGSAQHGVYGVVEKVPDVNLNGIDEVANGPLPSSTNNSDILTMMMTDPNHTANVMTISIGIDNGMALKDAFFGSDSTLTNQSVWWWLSDLTMPAAVRPR